jgi:hypothetical protein
MKPYRRGCWLLLLLCLGAGCARQPVLTPPAQTEAGETARQYFSALIEKDWDSAYKTLDAASRSRCSGEQFARLGEVYHRGLGFEPSEVHVLACDERGDEAIAHVNLKGRSGSSVKVYRDAVALHRGEGGWVVALPAEFGKPTSSKH